MRRALTLGILAFVACSKKPQGPDEFTKKFQELAVLASSEDYKDLEQAADGFYELYKANPKYKDKDKLAEALYFSGNLLYGAGAMAWAEDTAEAKRLFKKAIPRYVEFLTTFPTSLKKGQAYKDLLYCMFQVGEFEKLIEVGKKALEDPLVQGSQYLPHIYKYVGRAYTHIKPMKKDSAIKYLKEAYELFDAQVILPEKKAVAEDLKKLGAKVD